MEDLILSNKNVISTLQLITQEQMWKPMYIVRQNNRFLILSTKVKKSLHLSKERSLPWLKALFTQVKRSKALSIYQYPNS